MRSDDMRWVIWTLPEKPFTLSVDRSIRIRHVTGTGNGVVQNRQYNLLGARARNGSNSCRQTDASFCCRKYRQKSTLIRYCTWRENDVFVDVISSLQVSVCSKRPRTRTSGRQANDDRCTVKKYPLSVNCSWRVFNILTRPTLQCGPALHYSVDLRLQTYAEQVPLKYEKLATKYPWTYDLFSVCKL